MIDKITENLENNCDNDISLVTNVSDIESLTEFDFNLPPPTMDFEDDFNQNINDILKLCEITETSEQQYICNTQLKCSTTINLLCGLNPLKYFEPVVKIQSTVVEANITFTYFEWESLILKMDLMLREFLSNTEVNQNYELSVLGNIQLRGNISFDDTTDKWLQICKNGFDDFHLTKEEVSKILELDYIVSYNIEFLKDLNFYQYYFKVLVIVKEITGLYDNVNPLYLLKSFCSLSYKSIHGCCFRECLFFYKDKVLHDLEKCNV